jgi:hypothetical protein
MPRFLSLLRSLGPTATPCVATLVAVTFLATAHASWAQPGPPPPANTAGSCPAGMTRVDIANVAALMDASRGDGDYAGDPPNTCYFIANGTYYYGLTLPMYVLKGGTAPGARYFVGATRQGVVIRGRAAVESGVANVVVTNMTFDMTGYDQGGSYSTLTIMGASNVTVKDVTFTGDCVAGKDGGHIETDGVNGLLVDSVLVEKFGRCGTSSGHQDHGIYLSYGSNITIKNSIIRGNSSRGIQIYTGEPGLGLSNIAISRNWIYENGHADYEDGIAIGGANAIRNVLVERNLIYHNRYSGIRLVGTVMSGVSVSYNTFDSNGAGSTSSNRSEVNLDDVGSGAGTSLGHNIFNAGYRLINNCYDSAGRGFSIADNVLNGSGAPSGAGNCVGAVIQANPQFVDAANGDYHTQNPVVAAYGAYGGSSPPVSYTLAVAKAGTGSGTVTSSPAGISCGSDCSEAYNSGTVVTLTQTAASGSSFAGWSGACTGTGACQVTMSAAKSATASFNLNPVTYTLTVAKAGTGSGAITSSPSGISCGADCSESYNSGTVVTLSQAAASGSSFAGWSGACTGTGTCQVTMDTAKTVTASFSVSSGPYTLSITKDGDGTGSVNSNPPGIACGNYCSTTFAPGTVVTLYISTPAGSLFTAWSGDCSGTALSCQITMNSSKSVTAAFMSTTSPLTVVRTGQGSGTVTSAPGGIACGATCTHAFTRGTTVTLTADADAGSVFRGWSGPCSGTGACQVRVDAATNVTAIFSVTSPGDFYTVVPCRLLDTRRPVGAYGGPALKAKTTRVFSVFGVCGIPESARAIAVNVTVTGSTKAGNLRLFPADVPLPKVTSLNYAAGQTRANYVVAKVSPSGGLAIACMQQSGTAHVIVDVSGYFE